MCIHKSNPGYWIISSNVCFILLQVEPPAQLCGKQVSFFHMELGLCKRAKNAIIIEINGSLGAEYNDRANRDSEDSRRNLLKSQLHFAAIKIYTP